METVGIIAEYNPFHNGHKYHIEESRRITGAENVVVVMSGNFVQRGEPAVYDKWLRAEAAVKSGADLVIELPVVFSCSGAEFFARGAVNILSNMGIIDGIAFGAEETDILKLQQISEIFSDESDVLKELIRQNLKSGMSFAAARSKAAEKSGFNDLADIIDKPNNILAIEYLKQLNIMRKGSIDGGKIPEPVLIERKSSGYYEENPEDNIAGAGKLRELMKDGEDVSRYIPDCGFFGSDESENLFLGKDIFKRKEPCFPDFMYDFLLYRIVTSSAEELYEIDGVVEGLENRVMKVACETVDYESLLNSIKSKRYSRTSIQRMLVKILIGIKKSDMRDFFELNKCYSRVLAFNNKGAGLIRQIKNNNKDYERIKIITNINREFLDNPVLKKMMKYDIKASDIYDLLNYGRIGVRSDYRMKPGIIRD